MTKTFEVPFNTYPEKVVYTVKVTDRQEERNNWKRAVAIDKACEKFQKEHKVNGHKFVILSGVKEI